MIARSSAPPPTRTLLLAAAALFAFGFTLSAQDPPAPAPGAAPTATEGAARGGRGRGTGRNPNALADFSPKDPIPARSAADQVRTFITPPGYRMELVLSEPDVISPAIIEFDGNGRMYVVEFLSYMLDADGTGSHDPISRITRFESTKGDGIYDKRTVFADKLVLPRAILPLQDGVILTNETASDDLIKLTDTNGDGVADRKEVVYTGVGLGRDGNLEHEQMGFLWGMDNWIYSTYNAFRLRWTPRGFIREPTGPNGAQWGVSQDDDGKIWWLCGGCERGPINFQFPIHYGAWTRDNQFEPGFDIAWPVVGVGDFQGGMGRVRIPTNVLNHLTGTSGVDVVRGDRVPDDLRGDLLFGEPVGRFIRRARIVKTEGLTELRNVYPNSEFILSTDLYFRPVNLKTAPDGTVYIADMYHGIIQDSQWTLPGSYLRRKIEQYQLDKIINYGRVWRLRYDGMPAVPPTPAQPAAAATPGSAAVPGIALNTTAPRMYSETPAQLVAHLAHPNGWWRDTAQRLLVLGQDTSVVPALRQMASSEHLTGRFHALWTLEGLDALDPALVREAMADSDPRMRAQAIRLSETLYKAGNRSFEADYRRLTTDADADVAVQALLTLSLFKVPDLADVVTAAQSANTTRGVQEVGAWITRPAATGRGGGRGGPTRTPEQVARLERGEAIFNEVCFACHGSDGRGQPLGGAEPGVTMAPSVAGSPRVQGHRDSVVKTLLHGLTGPIDGETYSQVMAPLGSNNDEWIASVASYIRTSFGNTASLVTPADVARVRKSTAGRRTMWTEGEIESTLPALLMPQATWKATASHNTEIAAGALSLAGWTSAAPQQPGMWLQVELPAAVRLAEIQFHSPAGGRGLGIGSLGGYGTGRGVNQAGPTGGGAGRGRGAPPPPGLHPIGYRVQVSMDGKTWSRPVAEGAGLPDLTTIPFTPVQARFIRITQTATPTGTDVPVWSMIGLRLYEAPAGK